MSATDDLLDIANRYSRATNRALATVSSLAANDGKLLTRLSGGRGITVRRLESIMCWFSDNWPDGVEWPGNIKRPEKRPTWRVRSTSFCGVATPPEALS